MLKRNIDLFILSILISFLSIHAFGQETKLYMSQDEAQEFVDRWYPAWVGGAQAAPGLLEFFDEDATYVDPNVPNGVNGHPQLRRFFKIMLNANPNWHFETVNIFPTEKGLVLQWLGRIPTATGVIENFRGVDIFEFNEFGKITRLEEFFDLSVFKKPSTNPTEQ